MWPGCFSALGVLCDPFERQSGTNSAHPKSLLDQDVKTSSMWVHTKVIFCTVTLEACSEHLLPSQSLSIVWPWFALCPPSLAPCVCPRTCWSWLCAALVGRSREQAWASVDWCCAGTSVEPPAGELGLGLSSRQQSYHSSL